MIFDDHSNISACHAINLLDTAPLFLQMFNDINKHNLSSSLGKTIPILHSHVPPPFRFRPPMPWICPPLACRRRERNRWRHSRGSQPGIQETKPGYCMAWMCVLFIWAWYSMMVEVSRTDDWLSKWKVYLNFKYDILLSGYPVQLEFFVEIHTMGPIEIWKLWWRWFTWHGIKNALEQQQ